MRIAKKIVTLIVPALCSMTTSCDAFPNSSTQLHCVYSEHRPKTREEQDQKTRRLSPSPPVSATWTAFGGLIEGSAEEGKFGSSLALSANGRVLAGGAPEATAAESGKVQLHRFVSGQWMSAGKIDGTAGQKEHFGRSVALSWDGTRIIVGAPKAFGTGRARVYKYDVRTETWSKLGQDLAGPVSLSGSAQFGQAVAMNWNGNIVCIGAPSADNNHGLVQVFKFSEANKSWSAMGQVIYGQSSGSAAGFSLALSYIGNVLAIGSPTRSNGNKALAGEVQIFRYSEEGGVWSKIGQSIVGESEYEQLGYALSLSANGIRVAIGSPRKTDDANLPNKGAVQAFEYNVLTDQWQQIGDTIFGDDRSDLLGASFSLSAAGNQIAILKVVREQVGYYSLDGGQWTRVGNIIYENINPNRVNLSADGNKVRRKEAPSGVVPNSSSSSCVGFLT